MPLCKVSLTTLLHFGVDVYNIIFIYSCFIQMYSLSAFWFNGQMMFETAYSFEANYNVTVKKHSGNLEGKHFIFSSKIIFCEF